MRKKEWKSFLHKLQFLSSELDDRLELLNENKIEFEKAVLKELGITEYKDPTPPPLNTTLDIVIGYNDSFDKSYDFINSNVDTGSPDEPTSDTNDTSKKNEDSPDFTNHVYFKKLWKLIALKTHPDKTNNDPRLSACYAKAFDSLNKEEYEILFEVAIEIGIEIPEPDEDTLMVLKERQKKLEETIQHYGKLALWQWIQADPGQKRVIVKSAAEMQKKRKAKSK